MADNHRNTRQRNKSVACSWNKIKQKRATNEGNAKKKEKVVWFRDEAISRSIQYGAALAHVWRTKRTNDSSALLAKREGERKREREWRESMPAVTAASGVAQFDHLSLNFEGPASRRHGASVRKIVRGWAICWNFPSLAPYMDPVLPMRTHIYLLSRTNRCVRRT